MFKLRVPIFGNRSTTASESEAGAATPTPCFAGRSMRKSNRRFNESVEQPSQSHPCPDLVTCRHCGRRGLPERIDDHECHTSSPLGRLTICEHSTSTHQPPQSLAVDHLSIKWTPTEGSPRTFTFESTATGVKYIESTTTATTWRAGGTDSVSPLTLTLTDTHAQSTTQEPHDE